MRTELTLGAIAIISLVLMLMTFHDAEYALGISLTVMAIVYFPLGFWHLNKIGFSKVFKSSAYRSISSKRGPATFLSGFVLSMLSVGCMFKMLQLPGSSVLLSTGQIAVVILFILCLIFYITYKSDFALKLMGRFLIWGILAFVLFNLPSWRIVSVSYRDHPEYVNAYKQAVENPDDDQLQLKAEELRQELLESSDDTTDQ